MPGVAETVLTKPGAIRFGTSADVMFHDKHSVCMCVYPPESVFLVGGMLVSDWAVLYLRYAANTATVSGSHDVTAESFSYLISSQHFSAAAPSCS